MDDFPAITPEELATLKTQVADGTVPAAGHWIERLIFDLEVAHSVGDHYYEQYQRMTALARKWGDKWNREALDSLFLRGTLTKIRDWSRERHRPPDSHQQAIGDAADRALAHPGGVEMIAHLEVLEQFVRDTESYLSATMSAAAHDDLMIALIAQVEALGLSHVNE